MCKNWNLVRKRSVFPKAYFRIHSMQYIHTWSPYFVISMTNIQIFKNSLGMAFFALKLHRNFLFLWSDHGRRDLGHSDSEGHLFAMVDIRYWVWTTSHGATIEFWVVGRVLNENPSPPLDPCRARIGPSAPRLFPLMLVLLFWIIHELGHNRCLSWTYCRNICIEHL